ncbi:MAG: dioxygenase [Burkholderiaceae bacterium]|nr:dioxygenase [Burkholderiaceae bacterium]
MTTLPALFISHGSPMTALEPGAAGAFMQRLGPAIDRAFGRPTAVLAVSAHTLARQHVLLAGARQEAVYDFGGFPDALYRLRYDAPGAPALAPRVAALMDAAGLPVQTLDASGLDHGIWTPLRYIYPDADVPVLPLSFSPHDSPAALMALGRALAPLADEGVLIVGSGSLTHNLRLIYGPGGQPDVAAPETAETGAFRHWVAERTAARDWAALRDYRRQAPHAAFMHPTDEHWLPFYVAAGAGGEAATPRRLHASVTYGVLAMDLYAFGPRADTLAEETRDAVAA